MTDVAIADLQLVYLTGTRFGSGVEDPSYPYRLEVNLSPPELVSVAFVMLHGGSEEVIVRGKTREAIETFIARNHLRAHERLRRAVITGPDNLREEFGHGH